MDYAWSHAVISDETHNTIRESCDFYSNDTWSNKDCSQAVDEVLKQYNEIDIYSLYTSVCIASSAASKDKLLKVMYRSTSKMVSPRIYDTFSKQWNRFFFFLDSLFSCCVPIMLCRYTKDQTGVV